jgi:hypothetical protein
MGRVREESVRDGRVRSSYRTFSFLSSEVKGIRVQLSGSKENESSDNTNGDATESASWVIRVVDVKWRIVDEGVELRARDFGELFGDSALDSEL